MQFSLFATFAMIAMNFTDGAYGRGRSHDRTVCRAAVASGMRAFRCYVNSVGRKITSFVSNSVFPRARDLSPTLFIPLYPLSLSLSLARSLARPLFIQIIRVQMAHMYFRDESRRRVHCHRCDRDNGSVFLRCASKRILRVRTSPQVTCSGSPRVFFP